MSSVVRRAVVALGGNAITSPGGDGSVEEDYANLSRSLDGIVELVRAGYQITLTHGNGPQVGNQMIRVDLAKGQAPDLPLDVMVADIQGGLGYMIELVLRNKMLRAGLETPVCTLVTLVEVDAEDPAMERPDKFVGPVLAPDRLEAARAKGWKVAEDAGRGWRRVVPSPDPISIIERRLIRQLLDAGALVIDTGGGGVPVARSASGELSGVEAVVDKDFASCVLAQEIGAQEMFILTAVEQVSIHYGTPQETSIERMTASEARGYLQDGHFPPGSMGPKVRAACRFVEKGGQRALITDIHTLSAALAGKTGTWVLPDAPASAAGGD